MQDDLKPARSWQEIAEDASHERNPEKLLALTEELERALEARDKKPVQSEGPASTRGTSSSGG